MTPSGTVTVMLIRFSAAFAPVRLAQPSTSYIQGGTPAGRSSDGMFARSASANSVPYRPAGIGWSGWWTDGRSASSAAFQPASSSLVSWACFALAFVADSGYVGWATCWTGTVDAEPVGVAFQTSHAFFAIPPNVT